MHKKIKKYFNRTSKSTRIRLLHDASNSGFHRATNELGMLYKDGKDGVAKNRARAKELFTLATKFTEPDAIYNLGTMVLEDGGDLKKALDLFARAAALGSVLAQFNLGVAYVKGVVEPGITIKQNFTNARQWFKRCGIIYIFYIYITPMLEVFFRLFIIIIIIINLLLLIII